VGTVSISENEIGRLFVLPDFQHKGYGRALLDFAEKKVSEISAKIILDASFPAKAIYRKRGYLESDYVITETGYGDYLCYDIMEKQSSINA
ncbi:MAG: GNAT family N-acetyltransferase, partial [Treponema sp.]|nr:GNAT family N-acetyltransferase [Treponema sp.]